jgi:tetratricopeptide (TPR) repeat protein
MGDRSSEAAALNTLALICHELKDYPTGDAYFEQTLTTFREIGDRYGQALVCSNLGQSHRDLGHYAQAQEYYERAGQLWKQVGNAVGYAEIWDNLGWLHYRQGNYALARTHFEQALAAMQAIKHTAGCADALGGLAWTVETLADFAQARRYFTQALEFYRELDNAANIWSAQANLAFVSYRLGDLAAAERAYTELIQQCHHVVGLDVRDSEMQCWQGLAAVALHQGHYAAAQNYAQQAGQAAQDTQNRFSQAATLLWLGHAQMGLSDMPGAAQAFQAALALLRELPPPAKHLPDALAGMAAFALAQHDLPQALAYVSEIQPYLAAGHLEGCNDPMQIYLVCYHVWRAAGNPGAFDLLRTAYDLLQARAAQLETDAERRAFLENLTPHCEIVVAWQAERGDGK